jgi:hypothetical protein
MAAQPAATATRVQPTLLRPAHAVQSHLWQYDRQRAGPVSGDVPAEGAALRARVDEAQVRLQNALLPYLTLFRQLHPADLQPKTPRPAFVLLRDRDHLRNQPRAIPHRENLQAAATNRCSLAAALPRLQALGHGRAWAGLRHLELQSGERGAGRSESRPMGRWVAWGGLLDCLSAGERWGAPDEVWRGGRGESARCGPIDA